MWGFGSLNNATKEQVLLVDYAVPAGTHAEGDHLNATRGDAILEVGSIGAIYFTTTGSATVEVRWFDVADGETVMHWNPGADPASSLLDLAEVHDDGRFLLTGAGQTISGQLGSADEYARASTS